MKSDRYAFKIRVVNLIVLELMFKWRVWLIVGLTWEEPCLSEWQQLLSYERNILNPLIIFHIIMTTSLSDRIVTLILISAFIIRS